MKGVWWLDRWHRPARERRVDLRDVLREIHAAAADVRTSAAMLSEVIAAEEDDAAADGA